MGARLSVALLVAAVWCAPSAAAGQTPALKAVMREKLAHSQQLLDALVTSKWSALEEHAVALKAATNRPAWSVLESPEYVQHTARFVRALDDLIAAARRRDLEQAPMAYTVVTLSCVQCHRHIARMRLASGEPGAGR